jgi:hypothetical protein
MTLRELQKLLQSGDKRLYQKTIKKLIHRIARRYTAMSFEDLISYLRSFDAKPHAGSITTAPDIAKEKRLKSQKQCKPQAPTVGAFRANGLQYLLN